MVKYRAIVSVTFDDEDLAQLAKLLDVEPNLDPLQTLDATLDNLELGSGWIEQLFANGRPMMLRVSGGIMVEVNEHETNSD